MGVLRALTRLTFGLRWRYDDVEDNEINASIAWKWLRESLPTGPAHLPVLALEPLEYFVTPNYGPSDEMVDAW